MTSKIHFWRFWARKKPIRIVEIAKSTRFLHYQTGARMTARFPRLNDRIFPPQDGPILTKHIAKKVFWVEQLFETLEKIVYYFPFWLFCKRLFT